MFLSAWQYGFGIVKPIWNKIRAHLTKPDRSKEMKNVKVKESMYFEFFKTFLLKIFFAIDNVDG